MQCLFAPLKYAYLHVLKSQLSITQNPNYGILIMPVEKENTMTFVIANCKFIHLVKNHVNITLYNVSNTTAVNTKERMTTLRLD